MNEKSLDVLGQYDIEVRRVSRGRGGMLLTTNEGLKLFLECVHPDAFYMREDMITRTIRDCGYSCVDTYKYNRDSGVVTEDEDGRRYILKNWFDGRDCNTKDILDICDTVKGLAKLHIAMETASEIIKKSDNLASVKDADVADSADSDNNVDAGKDIKDIGDIATFRCERSSDRSNEPLYGAYERHMKELKMATNYLRNKKRRQDFELLAYANINSFYEEAKNAVAMLNKPEIVSRFQKAYDSGELCHGSFNYHNVIFSDGGVCITNFDHVKNECQIVDLYQFMRKILEKYDWNIELAYKMIDEYDKIRVVTDEDLEILSAMFAFPEKFWKIINYYFNMNKAWIPPKSIEKLKVVIEQNVKRKEFIQTLFA